MGLYGIVRALYPNGDINAQAEAIIGTYFYPESTIGFYTNKIINGLLRVNYLVVFGR